MTATRPPRKAPAKRRGRQSTILDGKRPSWIPEESWNRYCRNPAGCPEGGEVGSPLRKIMESGTCRAMFEAMQGCDRGLPFNMKLTSLNRAIDDALRARVDYVDPVTGGMDQRTRKRRAATVRSAVGKLQKALDEIGGKPGGLPLSVDLMLSWLDGSPVQGVAPVQHRFRELLGKLPEAVDAWADHAPAVSHVDANIGPRMLARSLRRMFLQWFDEPRDSYTLAVLGVVFNAETEDWDDSTLRKIAPADQLLDWSI